MGAVMEPIVKILAAAQFAAEKHSAQKRKGTAAEPYINHLIEVAHLVAGSVSEPATDLVIAALLHDTIEDAGVTREELVHRFGSGVADLVAEVTDDKSLPKEERKRLQIEHAPTGSVRAQTIKLADKISNLRGILQSPPADWDFRRRQEYFAWAKQVAVALTDPNPILKAEFDRLQGSFNDLIRLRQRGVDTDTRIIRQSCLQVDGMPVVQETWVFDGITGHSAVFLTERVLSWSDRDLVSFVSDKLGEEVGASTTFKRGEEFTFVNFGFST